MAEKATTEVLINNRLGYLKIPDQFRKNHGTPKNYPNPKAYVETQDGKVRLTYEWEEKEIPRS